MSPLNKRLPREFKSNLGKWLGIALLLILTISMVAGFLMAASSIEKILNSMDEDYNIEDGRFTSNFKMKDAAISKVEDLGVALYENFSYDVPLDFEGADAAMVARVFKNRTQVDLPAYFEGNAPEASDEIALDRLFCANKGIGIGDSVTVNGQPFTVSGIMSLSDYQALFEKNTDFVFNAQTFTVAQVSESGFESLKGASCAYTYSFLIDDRTLDDAARVDFEQDMLDVLKDENVTLSDFVDRGANQGIGYAKDDVEGDSIMWMVMLYLMIVILAFVFVVLTSATIEEESGVIGTLLASGYSKGELLMHYLTLPLISGIVGAVLGNVLGIAFFIESMSNLYYNSYSLPPYVTTWDWSVFAQSTVIPLVILIAVTLGGLMRKLRCTPLQFLRHETSKRSRKGGRKLPEALSFSTRFRLRVFGRNISHFATLFVGIMFASLLLLFGFCLLPTVDRYASSLAESLVSEHTYLLKTPVEIEGTPEEREMYAAALRLSDTIDFSDIDEDEVEDKLSSLLEGRIESDVRAQVENLFNEAALTRIVEDQVEGLFNADALKQVVAGKVSIDASDEKIAKLIEAGFDVTKLADADLDSLSAEDLATLVEYEVVTPRYVSLAEYGLGSVDILNASSAGLDGVDASSLNWGRLVDDGIMSSSVIDLSYYGLGRIDLAQTTDLESYFSTLNASSPPWQRLVDAGILSSTWIDLSRYGLGSVNLVTFDENSITIDDIDFDAFDFSTIDFDDIGLGSVDLGDMSKNEFFKLMQLTSKIDEDANVVNTRENPDEIIGQAEKFVLTSLEYDRGEGNGNESVSLYGIQKGSRYYTDLELADDSIAAGLGLMMKFDLEVGDTIELFDKYENETYTFTIGSVWGSDGTMNVYMPFDAVNELVGNDADYFSGYLSDEAIDFDERYVANDMTPEQMDKIGAQMEDSMGDMMFVMVGISIAIYIVLMYLLTKTIIERSARSISYMKVFGYRDAEIDKLYLLSITEVVVISLIAAIPIVTSLIVLLVKFIFMRYSGNFVVALPIDRLAIEVALGIACYAIVAFLHSRRIKNVPLALALKIQE